MPDHQTIVDSARAYLSSADQTITDELRALATDFADTCKVAEMRLRRCEDYLRRGLRAEAVHLAEMEPPVLDIVQALDFPGRQQWDELTSMYGLPVGPRVNLQRAAGVNQAYGDHQVIEPLLKKLRVLALSRAALSDRHNVLRELASIDRNSPFWLDDLKECEQALMKELLASGREAMKRGDGGSLGAIIQQLESTAWLMPPLPTMIGELRGGYGQFAAQASRDQLPVIARDLNRAARAQDYLRAVTLRQQLESEMARAQVQPNDPIFLQVQPALEWLMLREEEQRQKQGFEADCDYVEQLLESPKTKLEQLRTAWRRVESYGQPIPAALKKRFKKVREDLEEEVQDKRDFWKELFSPWIGIMIAGVLILMVVLGVLLYNVMNKSPSNTTPPAMKK